MGQSCNTYREFTVTEWLSSGRELTFFYRHSLGDKLYLSVFLCVCPVFMAYISVTMVRILMKFGGHVGAYFRLREYVAPPKVICLFVVVFYLCVSHIYGLYLGYYRSKC